jgi:putative oxygen-independent coproporphyrinogen III oxidase
MPDHHRAGLALYIHWPFCVSKCPYCDFNSHIRESVDEALWLQSLLKDLRHEALLLPEHQLQSIFFGGGTPSLMPPATVGRLIEEARSLWTTGENLEITLEANPSSVEASRFAALAQAGVNRVSLGIQSLDDNELRFLGRAHGAKEALIALEKAQTHFARVNADFIYALPGANLKHWEERLVAIIALGTDHLSLYQLTIEPGTRFETDFRLGKFTVPDEDLAADLFSLTRAFTAAAGLPAYEISNHARPGSESRHNLCYWRYSDYAGIGPGAHGRRHGMATVRHKKPENWIAAVDRNGHGITEETDLSPQERTREALVMGLRLNEGIALSAITKKTGLTGFIDLQKTESLINQGFLSRTEDQISLTEQGFPLLNTILAEIVTA